MVPLKIVSNVSRFKPALNLNRVLADLNRGSNSLNSISGHSVLSKLSKSESDHSYVSAIHYFWPNCHPFTIYILWKPINFVSLNSNTKGFEENKILSWNHDFKIFEKFIIIMDFEIRTIFGSRPNYVQFKIQDKSLNQI